MSKYENQVAECYSTWAKTYYKEYYGKAAPYPPVHVQLLKNFLLEHKTQCFLDAGCGPASFLRELFDEDMKLYGFDLTPEMVEEARRIFEENKRAKENIWQGSVLEASAFVIPEHKKIEFDAAICAGVFPHISEADEDRVIENLINAVQPGGVVAVEARNQLFALFTMNRYSYEFINKELIRSEELLAASDKHKEDIQKALEEMKKLFRIDIPPIRKGKEGEPGYDEVLSRTHNPIVMKQKFERAGLNDVKLLFYHFHCLPPMFSSFDQEFFIKQSLAMENPEDWRGHFMASAFYVTGTKQ